jgi:hypothetical protein
MNSSYEAPCGAAVAADEGSFTALGWCAESHILSEKHVLSFNLAIGASTIP